MTATQHSTKQDILHHLLKHGQATAQELADRLGVTPQAIRRHLKDLEADGIVIHHATQVSIGRPNYYYKLTSAGRSQFPDRYDEFAVSLLDTLAETVGKDQVSSILQKQWQRKALEYRDRIGQGELGDRVQRLVQLRRDEGYMAECCPVDDEGREDPNGKGFILTEYHCAISSIAQSFPSVCGHELEMFTIALECPVTRTHWLVNGEHQCGYLIQPPSHRDQ
jgi:DeoR family suf operon transcriptional repressor